MRLAASPKVLLDAELMIGKSNRGAVMNYSYYTNERKEVYGLVPDGVKRVLEVGCAAGGFRRNFPADVEYWGVEPFASAAEDACSQGIKVLRGTYESVENLIPESYFDVVVCNDVIEHMMYPEIFLESVSGKLKVGGVIVGSIPNVRFYGNLMNLLIGRDWRYEESGILDKNHLRFFTFKSFRRLIEVLGFRVEVISGVQSIRMNVLKVLFAPFLILIGFDVCYFQILFRIRR